MQTYTVTFENISQHKLIQDKSKLNVCALIIKKVTNGNQIKTTIENAAKCRVESGETGIKQVETNNKFAFEGDRIIVDGTNNKISTFALDGKAIKLSPTTAEGKTIINLNALTNGVYIIKINT